MTHASTHEERKAGGGGLSAWIAGALLVVVGLQAWSGWTTRAALDESRRARAGLDESAARLEKAAVRLEQVERRLESVERGVAELGPIAADWEFVLDDVTAIRTRVDEIVATLEGREGFSGSDGPPQPPQLDWSGELFEKAQEAAASVGITLTREEARVPARLVMLEGLLEYFAVLKGGKEHEALLSITGDTPREERRPRDLGAKLNIAIQALGFSRGKPIRFTPTGTRPAQGETIYLFVEWEEDGETVLVRAEDLVWDRMRSQPMPQGSWVYVGSSFVEGDEPGELVFAADLTAEAVATYSAVNTIIDTIAEGAQDDTVFLAATPRLPDSYRDVTLVIRREDREPTRTYDDPPLPADGDGDGDGSDERDE